MQQPTQRPLKVPREGINTRGEIVTKWWRAVCESCIISGCSRFIRIAFQPFQGPKQTEWWILFSEICPKCERCSCTVLATSRANERGGGVYVCSANRNARLWEVSGGGYFHSMDESDGGKSTANIFLLHTNTCFTQKCLKAQCVTSKGLDCHETE